MTRLVSAGAVLMALFTRGAALESQAPPSNSPRVGIQEGYPVAVISRLRGRNNALRQSLHNFDSQQVQSVITNSKLWVSKDNPLTIAFLGGTAQLRSQIMSAVQPWETASNVHFDFGPDASRGVFREWTRADRSYVADIRISFNDVGYWSLIGTDSIDPTVAKPNEASMNFQGFTTGLPSDWTGTVLHEFGHAIGLQHEHQSPRGNCSNEFRWDDDPGYVATQDQDGSFVPDPQGRMPGLYTVLGGPPNSWNHSQIDFNLKQLPNAPIYSSSAFDPKSIMMYSFQDWMFLQGPASTCYVPENVVLSAQDAAAALSVFPKDVAGAESTMATVRDSLNSLSSNRHIPGKVKTQYQQRLQSLSH